MTFSRILITGGTGSLGHALVPLLLAETDATIIVYSRDEYKQLQMRQQFGDDRLRYFIGDVRDLHRLQLALHGVDLCIHAAALKYVDVAEYNPAEVVSTNINGTMNVMDACRLCDVRRAILVSSDKAVDCCTLYGATKLSAERLWSQANSYTPHGTEYTTIRYANVTGSRGSVVPIWRSQLARGEPLTLTDRAMTRFWITLPEAAALVWWTAQHAIRGHVIVPDLPAYGVADLLRAVAPDVPGTPSAFECIGVRMGEKMAEVLMSDYEFSQALIYQVQTQEQWMLYSIPPLAPSWPLPEMESASSSAYSVSYCTVRPPYRSDVWPYRLSREDLAARLTALETADVCS